jgi:hypothetical protein
MSGSTRPPLRTPRQHRNRVVGFLVMPTVVLIGTIIGLGLVSRHVYVQVAQGALSAVAVFLVFLSLGMFFHYDVETRARDRILSGKDVLGRWTLSPEIWRWFLKLEAERAARRTEPYPNRVLEHPPSGEDPVEVIIGKSGLVVDDVYHSLMFGLMTPVRVEGALPCLLFPVVFDSDGATTEYHLSVPIPPGAEAGARAVLEHYTAVCRR